MLVRRDRSIVIIKLVLEGYILNPLRDINSAITLVEIVRELEGYSFTIHINRRRVP